MADTKSLKDQAVEAAAKLQEVGENTFEALKNSGVGKEVLGDDQKFDKDDVERLKANAGEEFKKAQNYVVGEDGKWGDDDKERLTKEAEALKDMASKDLGNLLNKK